MTKKAREYLMPDGKPETVSIQEAARRSGRTLKYWYDLVTAARMPAEKVDGRWRIPVEALAEYIANRRGQ